MAFERERRLEEREGWIPWREPLSVNGLHLACRFCIAFYGLKGADVDKLTTDRSEFDRHMREAHGR